jgi:chromosomal replication initiation ATPase DnaA
MKEAHALRIELNGRFLPYQCITLLDVTVEQSQNEGARLADVLSGARTPAATRARHATWAVLREAGLAYAEIARIWGMDHTSVMSGCAKYAARMAATGEKVATVGGGVKADERRTA